jgi:hypothetical protein
MVLLVEGYGELEVAYSEKFKAQISRLLRLEFNQNRLGIVSVLAARIRKPFIIGHPCAVVFSGKLEIRAVIARLLDVDAAEQPPISSIMVEASSPARRCGSFSTV